MCFVSSKSPLTKACHWLGLLDRMSTSQWERVTAFNFPHQCRGLSWTFFRKAFQLYVVFAPYIDEPLGVNQAEPRVDTTHMVLKCVQLR